MTRQAKFIIILILMTVSPYCFAQDQDKIEDQVAFKTIHFFNLRPKYSENEMQIILEKFNSLFKKLGHPECRYRVWKITEDKNQPNYLWESNWTSKSVYDEIHENEEFRKLIREDFIGLRMMFKDHSYYRYYELPF